MTTITLKINENSTTGKAFLNFIKIFVVGKKGVEIVKIPNAETEKAIDDFRAGKGIIKADNVDELFEKLKA